jgi:DNA-binding MarR family transcriptional regulator
MPGPATPRIPRRQGPRPPRPAEQAADALHSAAIHLLRSLRKQDRRLGVGPAGLSVLSVLVFGKPRTIGELAHIEQVRRATMTRIIQALERWELVERSRDTADGRRVLIRATTSGRVIMVRGRANRLAVLEERLARLGEDQLALLARAAELIERVSKDDALA